MTGRPGYRTMEMIGGSSPSYLDHTPCVPLLVTLFNRVGSRKAFRLPGAAGIISIVRWNLRPVIFGVEICRYFSDIFLDIFGHFVGIPFFWALQ